MGIEVHDAPTGVRPDGDVRGFIRDMDAKNARLVREAKTKAMDRARANVELRIRDERGRLNGRTYG